MYPATKHADFTGSIRCDGGRGRCEGELCDVADGGVGDVYFDKSEAATAVDRSLEVHGTWVGLFPPQHGYPQQQPFRMLSIR